jgi:DNA end-binding protein Ku
MRTKEYLVLLRARDDQLVLTTMLFHDEVRPTRASPRRQEAGEEGARPGGGLIEVLSADWDPDATTTATASACRTCAAQAQGPEDRGARAAQGAQAGPDLMAALEKTLADLKGGGSSDDLSSLSKDELLERAKEQDVEGRSSMSKKELIEALGD